MTVVRLKEARLSVYLMAGIKRFDDTPWIAIACF
jgi:hypothetical protein